MSTFNLYLIRHGLAGQHGDYENDRERPLTEEGKRKTRQIAKRLSELDLQFDLILTSPLVRAEQTAEILQEVGLSKHLKEAAYLAPGGNIQTWIDWLEDWKASEKSLALVGHEPDLSTWAETLIWGNAQGKLILKKAGAIGLTLPLSGSPIAHSQLFWLTPPRFFTA
ncbi:phosphohistidine phosphatase SixA [Phormidesmis priestleyi ULC007]|uniref:Phosphohistidine phosphatase SixA n=1 Tax=Phormidesmis priestleyi ULC007 TaxID=1920490 RepID=A0A2T1D8T6_9CYAN|nr:phosphohistidine phosphatase SixA [Phormidesmis priestleyi]PSB16919.1 phosphohistidine phosphatase SixA [Phormidesmis priestleyi ULC007]PZO47844.1 MAG: phosphohistidine phosphatase SixA [Phormidesmis priestleyi]